MSTARFSRRHRRALTGALVMVAAMGAVACGDDEAAGPGQAKAEFATYCDASFDIESYFAEEPAVDFETATPEQITAALTAYLQEAKPLVDAAVAAAPAELKHPLDVQVGAFNQALAGADPEEVFETPEVEAASDRLHAFDLENCGWGQVDVTARDYEFSGLPDELEAGRTSIELKNEGNELHEIVLLTRNPGVTETFDEILALPEEEGMTKVRPVSFAFAAPDDDEYAVFDLPAGEYVAVCFIPQGTISEETTPAPDAKPHFALGMKEEFTVA
jgi:hypothetical protein